MIALLLLAAIVVAVLFGLRRVPLFTLVAVALLGAALAHGLVRAPSALTHRTARAQAAVRTWQRNQTARWVCELRSAKALNSREDADAEAAIAACEKAH